MIEAMKQALEALETTQTLMRLSDPQYVREYNAITSLRQAIAEAEKQDKFCDYNCVWTDHHKDCVRASVSWKDMAFARLGVVRDKMHPDDVATVQRFLDGDYTHPQQKREWVWLTDEELKPFCDENYIAYGAYTVDFIKAIEAKLKEKNT